MPRTEATSGGPPAAGPPPEDGPGPPADPRVADVLRRWWGFDRLRPLQADAIGAALAAVPRGVDTGVECDAGREAPHQLLRLEAGHGFLCEARADFRPEAAREGWRAMLSWFEDNLP